jgi:hypothetical protein
MNSTSFKPKIKYQEFNFGLVYTNPALDKKTFLTEKEKGYWLGFYCVGHDYGNINVDRVAIHIRTTTKVSLHSEACTASSKNVARQMYKLRRFAQKRAQQFGEVLKLLKFQIEYDVLFETSRLTRNANLDNDSFVREHLDEYVQDIADDWTPDTYFLNLSWDEIKDRDLLSFFRFAHWIGTDLRVFRALEGHGYNPTLVKKERQIANFESDLLNSDLPGDYKAWVRTGEFQAILQKQPKFIQKAFQ